MDDLLEIQQLLLKAFRAFPRIVLSTCLVAHRGTDTTLAKAALLFIDQHLLCSHGPDSSCLAAEVLDSLPDTQEWLRQAIVLWSKG
jgi:hypothetical protein